MQSIERKHTDSSVKKMFLARTSVKKVMLTVFWDMKGLISIDFLEKKATVNRVSYCLLLRQNSLYLLNDSRMYKNNENFGNAYIYPYIYIYMHIYKFWVHNIVYIYTYIYRDTHASTCTNTYIFISMDIYFQVCFYKQKNKQTENKTNFSH